MLKLSEELLDRVKDFGVDFEIINGDKYQSVVIRTEYVHVIINAIKDSVAVKFTKDEIPANFDWLNNSKLVPAQKVHDWARGLVQKKWLVLSTGGGKYWYRHWGYVPEGSTDIYCDGPTEAATIGTRKNCIPCADDCEWLICPTCSVALVDGFPVHEDGCTTDWMFNYRICKHCNEPFERETEEQTFCCDACQEAHQ